jgi:hypothetical protein
LAIFSLTGRSSRKRFGIGFLKSGGVFPRRVLLGNRGRDLIHSTAQNAHWAEQTRFNQRRIRFVEGIESPGDPVLLGEFLIADQSVFPDIGDPHFDLVGPGLAASVISTRKGGFQAMPTGLSFTTTSARWRTSPYLSGGLEEKLAGRSNKEIVAAFHISLSTVKLNLQNIFLKLGAQDRTQATAAAFQRGIVRLKECFPLLAG